MSLFDDLVATMDTTIVTTFARDDEEAPEFAQQLVIHYNDGGADQAVTPVVKNPAMEEDYQPGTSNPNATMILLFVGSQYNGIAIPHGSTATYGLIKYDVAITNVDRMGGRTLKLRQRSRAGGF